MVTNFRFHSGSSFYCYYYRVQGPPGFIQANEHEILSPLPLLWYKSNSSNNQVRGLTLQMRPKQQAEAEFSDFWYQHLSDLGLLEIPRTCFSWKEAISKSAW